MPSNLFHQIYGSQDLLSKKIFYDGPPQLALRVQSAVVGVDEPCHVSGSDSELQMARADMCGHFCDGLDTIHR